MDNEDSFKRLSRSLNKFLDESSEYDKEKLSNFINYSKSIFANDIYKLVISKHCKFLR